MLLRCLLLVMLMVLGGTQPARADALLDAVVLARQQCAPTAPALRSQPRLDEAARRLAQGASLPAALQASGYRAQRSFQWRMSGYRSADAVGRALLQQHCRTLGQADLGEVGVHRQGSTDWIVVAAPFAPPPVAQAGEVAERVLALVNQARAQPRRCGNQAFAAAGPLTLDERLVQAARTHADSMARFGYLEHQGRDGSTPAERASRAGYDWRSVGENIASGQTTPERVVHDWIDSPEHCANIMEPRFTQMGVAFAVNAGSSGGIYWAQVFGRPR